MESVPDVRKVDVRVQAERNMRGYRGRLRERLTYHLQIFFAEREGEEGDSTCHSQDSPVWNL